MSFTGTEVELYKDFYESVKNIFTDCQRLSTLRELNIVKDYPFIHNIFNKVIKDDEDYVNWGKEDWLKNMERPELYLLSFLHKKSVTLAKIYNMGTESGKFRLLSAYKKLVTAVKLHSTMEEARTLIIEEMNTTNEVTDKKLKLMWNLKHFTNPENLGIIIDLLYHKRIRDNIINWIVSGTDHLDLSVLKEFIEEKNLSISFIESFLTKENVIKLFNFIMTIDIRGEVFANEELNNKVKAYLHTLHMSSKRMQNIFSEIEETTKNNEPFKERIQIIPVPKTKNFFDLCNKSSNTITLNKIDFLKHFNSFTNGKKVSYKTYQLLFRIRSLIFLFVQESMQFLSLSKEEKADFLNDKIEKYIVPQFAKDDEETLNFDSKIFTSSKSELNEPVKAKLETLIKTFLESINAQDELKELVVIKNEFVEKVKLLPKLDMTKIAKKDFNLFTSYAEKIFQKPEQVVYVVIKILKADFFNTFILSLESSSPLNVNDNIKNKIKDKAKELIDMLSASFLENKDFKDFAMAAAKGLDFVFYYGLSFFSKKFETKAIKQKVFMTR